MGTFNTIEGNLIKLALDGNFDVIGHGCNCFCTMGAGIAVQMKKTFGCDQFPMELTGRGDFNKLGLIDYQPFDLGTNDNGNKVAERDYATHTNRENDLVVVNMYTQYNYGTNHWDGVYAPFDQDAFVLCMKKVNKIFKNKKIGLPLIGGGLAGGDPETIISIMKDKLKDCNVTLVLYDHS